MDRRVHRALVAAAAAVFAWGLHLGVADARPPRHGGATPRGAEAAAPGVAEHGAAQHGAAQHGAAQHGTAEHGAAEHGAHGPGHHEAPGEINWIYGLLGEREGVEPSLAFRPPGMASPLLALLFNTARVFGAVYYFGRRPLAEALRARRDAILKGIEEAAAMKRDAAARLAEYQARLDHIDEEVARVEREMRAAGEAERERVLADARQRREVMERDARTMVALEAKAAIEDLRASAVRAAMARAREVLASQATAADQRRFLDDYLRALRGAEAGEAP